MMRRSLAVGAIMLTLAAVRPLAAAPVDTTGTAALAQVPADAPLVLYVRGVERTKDRLLAMAKNALPDLGPKIQDLVEEKFKDLLMGRQLKGLAKDGPLFLVTVKMPHGNVAPGNSGMAFVVAVTNFADFRDGLLTDDERKTLKPDKAGYETASVEGETTYFLDRNGYAVVTQDKEVAEKFLKKQPGLDGKLAKQTAQKLLASDVSLYVDMTAVNKEFGPQIKQFRPLIKFFIQQLAAQSGQQVAQMYEGIFDGIFRFVEDSRVLLVAGDFRPQGLAFGLQNQVGADTQVNAFLKGAKPGALGQLGTLPAGQLGYMAAELPPELFKLYGPALQGFYGSEDAEGKKLRDAWEALTAAGPQAGAMTFNYPTGGLQVWQYRDPVKAAAAQLKLFQEFQNGESFQSVPLKEKPVVKADAQNYRGFKLNSVRLVWDFDKFAEKFPQGKEMIEVTKRFMGESFNSWFGTDGKVYVGVTAKDWLAAQQLLAAYLDRKDPLSKQQTYQEARQNLPAETTLISLLDLPQFVQAMAGAFGPLMQAQGLPVQIPELKAPKGRSLFGFALTLRPEVISFDLWVPVTTVSEIKKMVEQAAGGQKIQ